jgi:hypothetical protein
MRCLSCRVAPVFEPQELKSWKGCIGLLPVLIVRQKIE